MEGEGEVVSWKENGGRNRRRRRRRRKEKNYMFVIVFFQHFALVLLALKKLFAG